MTAALCVVDYTSSASHSFGTFPHWGRLTLAALCGANIFWTVREAGPYSFVCANRAINQNLNDKLGFIEVLENCRNNPKKHKPVGANCVRPLVR